RRVELRWHGGDVLVPARVELARHQAWQHGAKLPRPFLRARRVRGERARSPIGARVVGTYPARRRHRREHEHLRALERLAKYHAGEALVADRGVEGDTAIGWCELLESHAAARDGK